MSSSRIKPRRAMAHCAGFFAALWIPGSGQICTWAQDEKPEVGAATPGPTEGRVREFAPGIEIDWSQPAVRLEARVVLREGPLELFACSPQTKEHESILVVSARPWQIFQAMGLIGIESGSPPRYDEALERWKPASGEPLDLRVEWRDDSRVRNARPEAWMLEKSTGRPPKELRWVFSGSTIRRDAASELSREAGRDAGRFAADSDGTVACVVDFDSALISLTSLHSADDTELWLSANPQAIPTIGTRCILTIRSAFHPKLAVEIDQDGIIRVGEEKLSEVEVGQRLGRNGDSRTPRLVITLTGERETEKSLSTIDNIRSELRNRSLDPAATMKVQTKATEKKDTTGTGSP